MKRFVLIPIFAVTVIVAGHSSRPFSSKDKGFKYVQKIESSCSEINGIPLIGFKLSLLPYIKPKNYIVYPCTYEKDKVFAGYPNKEKIELLEELLSYEGDTSLCSKRVCRYGYSAIAKPKTETYSTEIDALYLLTLLTASSHSPYYCPYPVLVDNSTGEEINNNQSKIKEVFEIYRNWVKENKKTNFVNYNLPLRDKSRYEWYGADKGKTFIFNDTFKIKQLDASAIVIGNCRD